MSKAVCLFLILDFWQDSNQTDWALDIVSKKTNQKGQLLQLVTLALQNINKFYNVPCSNIMETFQTWRTNNKILFLNSKKPDFLFHFCLFVCNKLGLKKSQGGSAIHANNTVWQTNRQICKSFSKFETSMMRFSILAIVIYDLVLIFIQFQFWP